MTAVPRWREIADELREAILDERSLVGVRLVSGARLPAEAVLSEHYEVSRMTVRRALSAIIAEGYIERRGTVGTFVRRLVVLPHSAHSENPDRKGATDTWFSEVIALGATPSQDFSFRIIPATSSVAKRLLIQVDDLVVVRDCLRFIDTIPWSEQVSYYPLDVARAAGLDTPHDIKEGTVRRLSARGYREIGWSDDVSSRPATDSETTTFRLGVGVSVLIYNRVGWTDRQAVRLTREILPADRNLVLYENGSLAAKYTEPTEGDHP